MTGLLKPHSRGWTDELSGWTLPPPSAQAEGEVEPVRVFESAEAAMMFLARQSAPAAPAEGRLQRVLAVAAT